jgi:hypothetical protein
MSAGGAAAAAAVAAEAERRRREEEEEMTKYNDADLQEGWEFKILRSNTLAFRKPEVFQKACQEEATAGWTLVEKFDDQRLRFKRPITAREKDSLLDFDPYRTQYGTAARTAIVVGCTVVGILFVSFLIIAAVFGIAAFLAPARPLPAPAPQKLLPKPLPAPAPHNLLLPNR